MRTNIHFGLGTLFIVLSISVSLFMSHPSFAQSTITTDGVVLRNANLRSGPGTTFSVIGAATPGQTVAITDRSAAGDWYQLSTGEWIASFLVEVTPTNEPAVVAPVGATANRTANLRGGPGTNHPLAGSVQPGQALSIVAQNQAGDWLKLEDGKWIAAFLVNNAPTSLAVDGAVVTQPAQETQPSAQPVQEVPPTATPVPVPPTPTPAPVQQSCDPSYPTICIPPGIADLDCGEIPYRRFQVVGADPHRFDGDNDGIGCER